MSAQVPGFEQMDADQLAGMVAGADDEQLAQGMASDGRGAILAEIFRRMSEHLDAKKAANIEAVVHWKILDRPDGGFDHYEVVIEKGTCTVSDTPERSPRVTLSVGPVDFLKVVSGKASGPELFMAGKLKIEGDLVFAATVPGLFRIPRPATPSAPSASSG